MTQIERNLRLDDLIIALKSEHEEMRRQLWVLRMLAYRADYDLVGKRALELGTFLNSHFAREESRTRDILAGARGSSLPSDNSAAFQEDELLRVVIREHKVMSDSLKEIQGLAEFSSEAERLFCFDRFESVFLSCLAHVDTDLLLPYLERKKNEGRRNGSGHPEAGEEYAEQNKEDCVIVA